jgi:hypothetical protein
MDYVLCPIPVPILVKPHNPAEPEAVRQQARQLEQALVEMALQGGLVKRWNEKRPLS